ncbi:nucleoside triphosphate diphosphatase, partial [Candidatus Hakubella thermalkaliphila]
MGKRTTFSELVEIMRTLRGPEGCPWDKEQTPQSIKKNLIEEAYEVAEAIDGEDEKDLKEELGDLLFQIIFHSQMASDEKHFDINDVIDTIAQKIRRRHPHIFGNLQAGSPDKVLIRWEQIKRVEREEHESQMSGLPLSLPALQYAFELHSRAARVGFDWEDGVAILQKLDEEVQELKTALESGQKLAREEM